MNTPLPDISCPFIVTIIKQDIREFLTQDCSSQNRFHNFANPNSFLADYLGSIENEVNDGNVVLGTALPSFKLPSSMP